MLPPKAIFEVEDLVGRLPNALVVAPEQRAAWFRRVPVWNGRIEPDHAPVLMMSKSGYVRQAALSALTQLPTPRSSLQHWCGGSMIGFNRFDTLRGLALNGCFLKWRRRPLSALNRFCWNAYRPGVDGSRHRTLCSSIFCCPECTAELVLQFARSTEISAGALRTAMRLAIFDNHILALSQTAMRPEFRAVLLKSMLDGEVTWVAHYERQWVDKRYGITRRVPVLARRPLQRQAPVDALIRQGAKDQSAQVRRAAASGLVKHAADLVDVEQLMALFAADQSPLRPLANGVSRTSRVNVS